MLGAILGDMIGSPYEFDRGRKVKQFPLFIEDSEFTDDTVMTIAVAEALMDSMGKTDDEIRAELVYSMQKWGARYPYAGYGGLFHEWLHSRNPKPYGSFGNGSAMRVASAGWLFATLEETRHMARLTAEVTHNHPEGIKGAEATASAIYMARTGSSKEEIREYIIREFGYDLSRTCDEIRPKYRHIETCQKTVPEAVTAFLEGEDFEDVIRTAVSLGGDCDTLTCIAGGMAEAMYGVPEEIAAEGRKRLPEDMLEVLDRFEEQKAKQAGFQDPFLEGNEKIEEAIRVYHGDPGKENLCAVLEAIRTRMHEDGHFMVPAALSEDGKTFSFHTLQTKDGREWLAVFTTPAELQKGESGRIISHFIDSMLNACLDSECAGLIINPWDKPFLLTRELIEMLKKADGDAEYTVPEDPVTPELLEGGSFLKRAVRICSRNKTQLNVIRLLRILRDSRIWIPCRAVLSDADQEALEKRMKEAEENGGYDTLEGTILTNRDPIRMVPDILQSGEDYFFPVFSSADEMGEYGNGFSKVEKYFLEAAGLARNNERNVKGIVINAFSEPFVIPREWFDLIEEIPSVADPQTDSPEEQPSREP